jgi:hypothetical protein
MEKQTMTNTQMKNLALATRSALTGVLVVVLTFILLSMWYSSGILIQGAQAESLASGHNLDIADIAPTSANSGVYTWTHELRSDWEAGAYARLDAVTLSGTLQLMTQYFSDQASVSPLADLHFYQERPALAIDATGNAYSVWVDRRNGKADLYFAYRPASGGWGTAVRVNDDSGSLGWSRPDIAVDNNGNVDVTHPDGVTFGEHFDAFLGVLFLVTQDQVGLEPVNQVEIELLGAADETLAAYSLRRAGP